MWSKNKLVRAVKNNKILGEGELEDYAYVIQALYNWLDYKNNKADQLWLESLIEQAWNRFHTKQGWLLAENSLLKYGEGEGVISDGVLPSASAVLVNISLKVANKTRNADLKKKSLMALNVGHLDIVSQPFWYSSQLLLYLKCRKAIKVVLKNQRVDFLTSQTQT